MLREPAFQNKRPRHNEHILDTCLGIQAVVNCRGYERSRAPPAGAAQAEGASGSTLHRPRFGNTVSVAVVGNRPKPLEAYSRFNDHPLGTPSAQPECDRASESLGLVGLVIKEIPGQDEYSTLQCYFYVEV